jgi:hypothetical protein
MEHCSQERPSAMTSDPASRFPRPLTVAGAAVAERSAAPLARVPAESLEARTLLAHVHTHRGLGMLLPFPGDQQFVRDGSEIAPLRERRLCNSRMPALRPLAGGSTA